MRAPINEALDLLNKIDKALDVVWAKSYRAEDRLRAGTLAAERLRDLITSDYCRCGKSKWREVSK